MGAEQYFVRQVADAYQHLYDIVYLRTHPLVSALDEPDSRTRKEKAWALHHLLLDTIAGIDPGEKAPSLSVAWRRHKLMQLRFVDGMEVPAVAEELAISRRTYYREKREAIRAVAELLWDRSLGDRARGEGGSDKEPTRLELVRIEAARASQTARYASIRSIIHDATELIQNIVQATSTRMTVHWDSLPDNVMTDRTIMRQLLLGLLTELVDSFSDASINIDAVVNDSHASITLTARGTSVSPGTPEHSERDIEMDLLSELARSHSMQIVPTHRGPMTRGYTLTVPTEMRTTILVVDDNDDTLRLFERFLTSGGYAVAIASSGRAAINAAKLLQPAAITLDLMMPDQDGWDVLQTLANHPQTQDIPVIICTVLAAKKLALSLGAAAFLPKPVSEQSLLSSLQAVTDH